MDKSIGFFDFQCWFHTSLYRADYSFSCIFASFYFVLYFNFSTFFPHRIYHFLKSLEDTKIFCAEAFFYNLLSFYYKFHVYSFKLRNFSMSSMFLFLLSFKNMYLTLKRKIDQLHQIIACSNGFNTSSFRYLYSKTTNCSNSKLHMDSCVSNIRPLVV